MLALGHAGEQYMEYYVAYTQLYVYLCRIVPFPLYNLFQGLLALADLTFKEF